MSKLVRSCPGVGLAFVVCLALIGCDADKPSPAVQEQTNTRHSQRNREMEEFSKNGEQAGKKAATGDAAKPGPAPSEGAAAGKEAAPAK